MHSTIQPSCCLVGITGPVVNSDGLLFQLPYQHCSAFIPCKLVLQDKQSNSRGAWLLQQPWCSLLITAGLFWLCLRLTTQQDTKLMHAGPQSWVDNALCTHHLQHLLLAASKCQWQRGIDFLTGKQALPLARGSS